MTRHASHAHVRYNFSRRLELRQEVHDISVVAKRVVTVDPRWRVMIASKLRLCWRGVAGVGIEEGDDGLAGESRG